MQFVRLRAPGTAPGIQAFDVNEYDALGGCAGTLQSGFTVPEPVDAALLGTVLLALALCCVPRAGFAPGASEIERVAIEKESERRIRRAVHEYTCSVRAKNNGVERYRDVQAVIAPIGAQHFQCTSRRLCIAVVQCCDKAPPGRLKFCTCHLRALSPWFKELAVQRPACLSGAFPAVHHHRRAWAKTNG